MKFNSELVSLGKKKTKSALWIVVRSIFIIGFCVVILSPVLDMISHAFMGPKDLYDQSVMWIPKNFTFDNILVAAKSINFGEAFANSLWSTVLLLLLQILPCLMAGYGFARYDFKFKNILFAGVILTLIVPPQLTMIASYMDFNDFDLLGIVHLFGGKGANLLDTMWPQVLLSITGTYLRNGLFIYLFRQAFIAIPKATEEAALVDGSGDFRTFFQVMLPSVRTTITTVILFGFVWQWNDTFYGSMYNGSFNTLTNTIPTADYPSFIKQFAIFAEFSQWDTVIRNNMFSTAALLLAAFPILLFIILQKQFVESIEKSGVVG